jgi:adenylate cyclase
MDDNAARALQQSAGIWDRRVHTRLIQKLTAEHARAVLLDLVFTDASIDPVIDEEFAAAIRENGHVVLSAGLEIDPGLSGYSERVLPPTALLRRAAAGWGLAAFRPVDSDYGIRRLYTGTETVPTSTWRLAKLLGAPLAADYETRKLPRWLNFYGPVGCFSQLGYDQALSDDGPPPGFFRDKIVFVGGRSSLGTLGLGKDDFGNPNTRFPPHHYSPGLEIHATAFSNLHRQEWLTHLDAKFEDCFVLVFGIIIGTLLPRVRPFWAAMIGVLLVVALGSGAFWLVWQKHVWFAWCVPALVQVPLAVTWTISMRYLLEERRRKALRNAFSHYLSPQMADRIANAQFDLRPGGTVVEASIMFTDLEGFTTFSEKLKEPEKIAQILTAYFTQTTGHILENDGTIIKYIGDAVFAVWGAPLPDPNHPKRAALAAWRLHQAAHLEVDGKLIRTRIGLHTGRVLSGNLGSAQRFDYTVIGDATNFASRLEGLNKYFGTSILISEATRERLEGAFLTRSLGNIQVAGKSDAVEIHELLGPSSNEPPLWVETFAQGLACYRQGDFAASRLHMEKVSEQRGESDGPARFYLEKISEVENSAPSESWTGTVVLASK